MPRPKSNNSACKFCRKRFGVDPNPTVLNQPDDLLKRRCPMSKDCKVCHGFIKNHPVYSEMSSSALETHLQDPQNFEKFIREHEEWCEQRRNGSKRRHAEGKVSSQQYLWGSGLGFSKHHHCSVVLTQPGRSNVTAPPLLRREDHYCRADQQLRD